LYYRSAASPLWQGEIADLRNKSAHLLFADCLLRGLRIPLRLDLGLATKGPSMEFFTGGESCWKQCWKLRSNTPRFLIAATALNSVGGDSEFLAEVVVLFERHGRPAGRYSASAGYGRPPRGREDGAPRPKLRHETSRLKGLMIPPNNSRRWSA